MSVFWVYTKLETVSLKRSPALGFSVLSLSVINHYLSTFLAAVCFHSCPVTWLEFCYLYKTICVFCVFENARYFICKAESSVLTAKEISFSHFLTTFWTFHLLILLCLCFLLLFLIVIYTANSMKQIKHRIFFILRILGRSVYIYLPLLPNYPRIIMYFFHFTLWCTPLLCICIQISFKIGFKILFPPALPCNAPGSSRRNREQNIRLCSAIRAILWRLRHK